FTPSSLPLYIFSLSLHDALPIYHPRPVPGGDDQRPGHVGRRIVRCGARPGPESLAVDVPVPADPGPVLHRVHLSDPRVAPLAGLDRKSTRLNSSHVSISYAVFCL